MSRSSPPPGLPIRDLEGIGIEDIFARAYTRALFCLGDETKALRIATNVTTDLWKKWSKQETQLQSDGQLPHGQRDVNSYKHASRAWEIDIATHAEIREARVELMSSRYTDTETLTTLYMEELLTFVLNHDSSYAVIAILMFLCKFDYDDVEDVFTYLDSTSDLSGDEIRKQKKRCMDFLQREFRGLIKKSKKEHKTARRFVPQAASQRLKVFADTWLAELKPLRPHCFLCQNPAIDPSDDDVEAYLKERARFVVNNAVELHSAVERERILVMVCSKCLSRYLAALGRIDWKDNLGLPKFFPENGRNGTPPINRQVIPRLTTDQKQFIGKVVLGTQDIQLASHGHAYVSIKVDGLERRRIPLKKRTIDHFHVKDGENVIKLSLVSNGQTHPLDLHFIRWDTASINNEPVKYTTLIDNERKFEITLTYNSDSKVPEASVDLVYDCPLQPSWVHQLWAQLKAKSYSPPDNADEPSQDWTLLRVTALSLTATTVFGAGAYFFRSFFSFEKPVSIIDGTRTEPKKTGNTLVVDRAASHKPASDSKN